MIKRLQHYWAISLQQLDSSFGILRDALARDIETPEFAHGMFVFLKCTLLKPPSRSLIALLAASTIAVENTCVGLAPSIALLRGLLGVH